jgi:5'/3'-nucleotidase SurE
MVRVRSVVLRLVLGVWLALPACVAAPALADLRESRLHILLTNDDGVDAPGLQALRSALRPSGHRLSVVAPSGERSGSSVALTTRGTLSVRSVEPGVFAVEGTPADCVRIALEVLLDEAVDLVVSGVNFGQNIGSGTLVSGTVGAALMAAARGVPAIAVSQTVDPVDVRGTNRFFPDAAAFAASLVGELAAQQVKPLLPRGIVLNVNHPPRHRADLAGVRFTRQGRTTLYELRYERGEDGALGVTFAPSGGKEPVADADTTAVSQGYVSVTPLDGDWTAGDEEFSKLRPLVERLGAKRAR